MVRCCPPTRFSLCYLVWFSSLFLLLTWAILYLVYPVLWCRRFGLVVCPQEPPLVIALGFGDRAYPTISGDGMFNFGGLAVLPENELGVTSRSYLV